MGVGGATATAMALVETLLKVVADVAAVGDEVKTCKRSCWNLSRRIKLLAPLFEEIRDVKGPLPPAAVVSFQALRSALLNSRKILMECCTRSRLFMVRLMYTILFSVPFCSHSAM